jgi:hypothetical protein
LRHDIGSEIAQRVRPDHDDHAEKASAQADRASGRELVVAGRDMRDQHGEKRRRSDQNRGETARDINLTPEDQAERQHVIEQPHHCKRAPDPARRQFQSHRAHDQDQQQGAAAHASERHREGRQLRDGDFVEEERSAPKHRQDAKQQPVGRGHSSARSHAPIPCSRRPPAN